MLLNGTTFSDLQRLVNASFKLYYLLLNTAIGFNDGRCDVLYAIRLQTLTSVVEELKFKGLLLTGR